MTCKHNWHFVDGLTKRIRCTKCALMQFVDKDMDKYLISSPSTGFSLADTRPNNIVFYNTLEGSSVEVLRISPEGVTANPDIPTDEAAQAVLRSMDGYLKTMIDKRIDAFKYKIGVDSENGQHCVVVMRDNGNGTATMVATTAIKEAAPDYAYSTIEDYEELVGFKVNDAFRVGWSMARTTNDLFAQMINQMEDYE